MSAKGSLNIRKGYWKLMFLPLFAYLDIPNVDGQGLTRLDFKPGQVGLECLAVRALRNGRSVLTARAELFEKNNNIGKAIYMKQTRLMAKTKQGFNN